jgi:hypothetical protein
VNFSSLVKLINPTIHQSINQSINQYAPFVTLGSYIVVEDTWQRHPLFAAEKFLEKYGDEFLQDRSREHLLFSQHKGGFLKRVALPTSSALEGGGGGAFDYSVDVAVAGGRTKTYGRVPISSMSQAAHIDRARATVATTSTTTSSGHQRGGG